MRPQPMTMQMARPTSVPTHTCSEKTISWGSDMCEIILAGTHLLSQLLVNCGILLGTQLLLEEGQENRDDDSGFYCLTKDDEEDWDREDVRHSEGESPDRVNEGRSGLTTLRFQCSCWSRL